MSSPIAKSKKNIFERWLVSSHKKLSHDKRVLFLSDKIAKEINDLNLDKVRFIDVGCGDMSIATLIQNKLPNSEFIGIDCYPLPDELKDSSRWKPYTYYDGKQIPFEAKSFDVAILCDVLHHDIENAQTILGGSHESEQICNCERSFRIWDQVTVSA